MYVITYKGIDGQTGLYARVQRIADGKWWNENSSLWQASEAATCNISLTEGATAGKYTGSGGFNPVDGHVYSVSVYNSTDTLLLTTEDIYKPEQLTVLEIINQVQKELRLPQSTLITEPHAQLLLSFMNAVLDLVTEAGAWHELSVRGSLPTQIGVGIYALSPVNALNVDTIRNLQISTNDPIEKYSDGEFRAYKRANTTTGQPLIYRIYGRAGGVLLIELCPVPDQVYAIGYEVLQKQERLVNSTDKPLLDADIIIRGTTAKAREEAGLSNQTDMAAFQAKLELQTENQGESNWQDVEPT